MELHARDRGVGVELLEGSGVEFPGERGAGLGVGGDAFLEEKSEFNAGVADLFIERFAQEAQKGG